MSDPVHTHKVRKFRFGLVLSRGLSARLARGVVRIQCCLQLSCCTSQPLLVFGATRGLIARTSPVFRRTRWKQGRRQSLRLVCMAATLRRVWAKATCTPEGDASEKQKLLGNEHLGAHASAFGKQSISTVGSFCLCVNNIIGPGVLTVPALLQVCTYHFDHIVWPHISHGHHNLPI